MDEDDGLLLNITTSSAPKPAKKVRKPTKTTVKRASSKAGSHQHDNTPIKAATAAATAPTSEESTAATTTSASGLAPGTKVVHGKAQVVSSLFSSNPDIPRAALKKTIQQQRREGASNAPIDSSTFTGIGIESDLAEHLHNKFNVSTPTNVQAKAIPVLLGPSFTQQKEDIDVVVQAETGSGKTLTYLLPIVNRLVAASTAPKNTVKQSEQPFGDRSVGTVAIILTPTRELAQQVVGVLTTLVNLPRPKEENVRRLHWIVPGIVIGGDSKAKEKARLRKGVNVLVSTPGRLLDHLENTKSFDISNLKWLVLDEADRLLDLGFEETLKKIMNIIQERTKRGSNNSKYRQQMMTKYWPKKRQTILCSATLREDVKELAGWSLENPAFVSGTDVQQDAFSMLNASNSNNEDVMDMDEEQAQQAAADKDDQMMKFTTPNQLKQTYTIIPAKLRLITLLSLLRSCFYDKVQRKSKHSKVIVFFSCCDSVDFHFDLFSNAGKPIVDDDDSDNDDNDDNSGTKKIKNEDEDMKQEKDIMQKALQRVVGTQAVSSDKKMKKQDTKQKGGSSDKKKEKELKISQLSTLLLEKPVFRLHGDLNQQIRSQTFAEFSKVKSGVLFCTDVAARGLDLPNVDHIIQYDVPTDLKDYVHRVGRTARLGKAGTATLFLLPSEIEYLDILKAQDLFPEPITMETILANLAQHKNDYQTPAQELQNTMEQYILSAESHISLARKAFWSTCRAYATHPASEKHIFHIKRLHLGHLAKSFALREAPSHIHEESKGKKKKDAKSGRMPGMNKNAKDNAKPKKNIVNPLKRSFDHASEFAVVSASSIGDGPTTKKKKKKNSKS